MQLAAIVITIIAIIFIYSLYSTAANRKNRFAKILRNFGQPPKDTDYELKKIQRYAIAVEKNSTGRKVRPVENVSTLRVDNITWHDLDMDNVFKRINTCLSSVGEEYLYNQLHEITLTDSHLARREQLIAHFESHPQDLLAVQKCLFNLGKPLHNGVSSYIFEAENLRLPRATLYKVLATLPFVCIAAIFIHPTVGILGLVATYIVNLIFNMRVSNYVEMELPTINYFSQMVRCSKNITKTCGSSLPVMTELEKFADIFKKAAHQTPAGMSAAASGDIIYPHLNILFLLDARMYNRLVDLAYRRREELHNMFQTLGELDMAICIMSFRKSLPHYTTPQFSPSNEIKFAGLYHPLIAKPVANSGHMQANSLITGSNASGKSSFIKALAINGILAQTINTCTAQAFTCRHSLVVSSMAVRDDLLGGDSYFVVEVKSIKRILDLAQQFPCTCYIDEILRGTNTVERIAASAAVLTHLHEQDCLAIVATHDIELTQMLPYDNYHFTEQITEDDVIFDYTLRNGPSTSRNAIALIRTMGFDKKVVEMAEGIAADGHSVVSKLPL